MDVRQIAISPDGPRAALGAFAKQVEIWDIGAGTRISAFDTILDFGGRRLALAAKGQVVIAAAYERYGIAGYEAESGNLLWTRPDLKKAQHVTSSVHAAQIYAGFERGPGRVIASRTGETISQHRGVRRFVESLYEPLIFLDAFNPIVTHIHSDAAPFAIKRLSFAFLDVAFSPGQIAVSEAGGGVRCFNIGDDRPVWTFTPPMGVHCLKLVYSRRDDAFIGIIWPYLWGGDKHMVKFSSDGQSTLIANIGKVAETAFDQVSATLVTSGWTVFSPSGESRSLAAKVKPRTS
jgi:WD40 repeat protein